MASLIISIKLFFRRFYITVFLFLQVFLSLFALSQVFTFIVDHLSNVSAVKDLSNISAVILHTYDYYPPEYVYEKAKNIPGINAVGMAYYSDATCNEIETSIVLYSDEIVHSYQPSLTKGKWFSSSSTNTSDFPVVVSSDIATSVSDKIDIYLPSGIKIEGTVIGIINEPAQFLFPTGSASPQYFSANSLVGKGRVIMFNFDNTLMSLIETDIIPADNLFLFVDSQKDIISDSLCYQQLNQFGEITPMDSLVETYIKNTNVLISSGAVTFFVFFSLALTSILSTSIIQSERNKHLYTIFYLVGMNWKSIAFAESFRILLTILFMSALAFIASKLNFFMISWLTPSNTVVFYIVIFAYIIVIFAFFGICQLRKLVANDISVSLQDLNCGE